MNFNDDKHLDVCQNIEAELVQEYSHNPQLTDLQCMFALDNAKIAVKQRFGFAKNETISTNPEIQSIIAHCVGIAEARVDKINMLTLKEFVACLEKIRRSVQRHSQDGPRAYYDFVRQYFQ